MSKKFGICAKCSYAITKPVKAMYAPGGKTVTFEEITGCTLCDNPKVGDNCPLVKRARKPTVVVHLWNGTIADIISNDPNVDLVFVDEDEYRDENNARTEEGSPCNVDLYRGVKNLNPKKVGYWRKKALRNAQVVADV